MPTGQTLLSSPSPCEAIRTDSDWAGGEGSGWDGKGPSVVSQAQGRQRSRWEETFSPGCSSRCGSRCLQGGWRGELTGDLSWVSTNSHSPRRWPTWGALVLLHQIVLVQETTKPFCPASNAMSPGLFGPHTGLPQAPDPGSPALAGHLY